MAEHNTVEQKELKSQHQSHDIGDNGQSKDTHTTQETDTQTTNDTAKASSQSRKKDSKHPHKSSRHHSRDRYRSHRSKYRHKSRSNSRSHSPQSSSQSRSRSRQSHSRSPSHHRRSHRRDRSYSRHRRHRRHHRSDRHRHHSSDRRRYKRRRSHSSDHHSDSHSKSKSKGPTMAVRVTVYPKSTPGESKIITFDIARTATVSDFKGTLCARGFNVFLQYNLYVGNKELEASDDRLLCVHAGIKERNKSDGYIMVKPKGGMSGVTTGEYNPFLTESDGKDKGNAERSEEEGKKRMKEKADQIEMYKAYEEMFGLEEAAGMMGLDPSEIKKNGIETIVDKLEQEKERKRLDKEAAEAARSNAGGAYDYSEEMLFAQKMKEEQGIFNENSVDNDTAPGTTHTAGGGTVSRPPPEHVSENACIFVGDLHPMVTRSDLLSVFSQIGQVQWIQLFDCHKQMNRPFNFAFVYFEDLLCARNAIQTLNYTKFYGAPCRLMWKQEKNAVQWTDCNIIVKNLPPNTDSQLLHSVFNKFGKILSSKVKTTATGRTLPYGYVQYGNKESAEQAILASDKSELSVNGHLLTAEWFKSREDRAFRQIYVKNIPNNWSDTDLLNLFEAQTLGKIKSFTVKHSPYGRWACISFHEPTHAVKAIEKLNNCPTGDPMSPQLSVSRFMYKTERDKLVSTNTPALLTSINGLSQSNTVRNNAHMSHQCYSIYVGNVPLQLTDEHMRQLFEPFGAVISAAVVQKTQDYKYGFVNFQSPKDAARALVTMNGKSIGGKTLQVKPANTDMSKAIAITQAANLNMSSLTNANANAKAMPMPMQKPTQNLSSAQAKQILFVDENKEKVWKVQYGEDWHEYDTTLAAIVEQLQIGQQIQITLADSNYIITRMKDGEAMQKNCASGTMRKVVRSIRET